MWSFEAFYLICFGTGLVYALVVGFFAGVLGGDHDVSGGHDVDVSGGIGGDLHPGDFSGGVHFSPLSPVVISSFLVVFGGSGLIYMRMFKIDGVMSILPALLTAFAIGAAVFMMFDYIFKHTQGGVEVSLASLIGREAEVTTPIPADGMGEISFFCSGGRMNAPARSQTGQPIPKNSLVTIAKIVGNVYLVSPAPPAGMGEPAENKAGLPS